MVGQCISAPPGNTHEADGCDPSITQRRYAASIRREPTSWSGWTVTKRAVDRRPKVSQYLLTLSRKPTELHPKYLPADERRSLTVAAVLALAAEQDPGAITTSAIAQRMHLTQGALFRHFPTKDSVWQAVMEWVAERLLARVDQAAQTATTPLGALEAMFMAHVDFVAKHPGVPRMLFGELQRAEATPAKRLVQTLITQYGVRLHSLIEKGKAQGELAADVDPIAAATLFIGSVQGLVMQSLLAGNVRRIRSAAPGAFAIFARGIRKTP